MPRDMHGQKYTTGGGKGRAGTHTTNYLLECGAAKVRAATPTDRAVATRKACWAALMIELLGG